MTTRALSGAHRFEAVCIPTATRLHPWDDPVGAVPVLEHTLADAQRSAVEGAGGRVVDRPSGRGSVVWYSDRQWFTAEALRRLLEGPPGRLRVTDTLFWETTGSLQDVPADGVMELAWGTGLGEASLGALDAQPVVDVELDLEDHGSAPGHARLRHAHRPLRVGAASVHLVQHWTHLLRVNQLAIQAEAFAARDRFAAAPAWRRAVQAVRMIWQAGGVGTHQVAAALVTRGPDCDIHPTAVVEASRLGARVRVGPHAVVRGAVLQDDVEVGAHAAVVSSVMARGARVGPYGHLRYSTLFPGARVSAGPGYQMCVFGRECFLAWGVAALDLSFGRPIATEVGPGVVQDTGHHFLGCAVGHRTVIGQGVRLAPGAVVPSGATLVAPNDHLYGRWGDTPRTAGVVVPTRSGVRRVGRSGDGAGGGLHGLGSGGKDALLGDDAGDEARGGDVESEVPGR